MKKIIREACVENINQALKAIENNADRIELCENLTLGGTTPSYGTLKTLTELTDIPIFPMIRPRGGDFCYNFHEINAMISDIELFKTLNIKGVVLGVLTSNLEIDYPLLKKLIKVCGDLEVTFHKAIDEVSDPVSQVKFLEEVGAKRILTSGKKPTALKGINLINKMIEEASNLKIVVAGKVTNENLKEIKSKTNAFEFHGKKIVGDLI